jgi:hypothetical protein
MRRSQDLNDDGTTLPEHIERVLRHGVNIPAGPLRVSTQLQSLDWCRN